MRKYLLAITIPMLIGAATAAAEPPGRAKSDQATPEARQLPLKRATSGNSCAAYGAGFVKVEGSDTCVKVGGSIGFGVGASSGSR